MQLLKPSTVSFPLPRTERRWAAFWGAVMDRAIVKGATIGILATLALWAVVVAVIAGVWRMLDAVGL